jgi:hypothetical protein
MRFLCSLRPNFLSPSVYFAYFAVKKLHTLSPVSVVTGRMQDGGDDHDFLGFLHLVDHAVGKKLWYRQQISLRGWRSQ